MCITGEVRSQLRIIWIASILRCKAKQQRNSETAIPLCGEMTAISVGSLSPMP